MEIGRAMRKGNRNVIFTTEWAPKREGWIFEAVGGGHVGYRVDARPDIQWNHIDGPVVHFRNGEMHWLTWRERFRYWRGYETALTLEAKHRPHLARADAGL
jgi:hypothetical protein